MKPIIHIVPVLRDNYCYIIEGENKACIIVDPGQVKPVELFIAQHGLRPTLILNTHHHADHVAGNAELKTLYNVPIHGPKAEAALIPHMTHGLSEGDVVTQDGITLTVAETPGHTLGHIVFYCSEAHALFAGDTLFSMGCGRLLEGTPAQMYESLQRLKALPPETEIYCGHEYTQSNGEFALSVDPSNTHLAARMAEVKKLRTNNLPTIPVSLETELKTNPFLTANDLATFTERRAAKDNF